ncbi:MAG: S1 RNA-binding domain-containing protein [Bacilli bacterium]|nr:S1 RNA-binding domain-containing protein [Bacilli bacterium]
MFIPEVGKIYEGTVAKVFSNYAILIFEEGFTGLLHISETSDNYIRSFTSLVKVGKIYNCKVISLDPNGQNIKVSIKKITAEERKNYEKFVDVSHLKTDFTSLSSHLGGWIDSKIGKEEKND